MRRLAASAALVFVLGCRGGGAAASRTDGDGAGLRTATPTDSARRAQDSGAPSGSAKRDGPARPSGKKAPAGLSVGDPAPFFVLKTMNEALCGRKTFALKEFVGTNRREEPAAVVLSFAASYCVPCKKELTELKRMVGRFVENDVLLAVVVIDTEEAGISEMKALTVDELALDIPVLSDRFGVLARRYRASALPMTVVVDPTGKVTRVSTGYDEGALEKLMAALGI